MNIRGRVSVEGMNTSMRQITGGTTGGHLSSTTAVGTGDYLSHLLIRIAAVTTVGSCSVLISNGEGTVQVFGPLWAATITQINSTQQQVDVYSISKVGPWRLTCQAGVDVTAIGRFS